MSKKKLLSWVLVVAMCLGMLPTWAMADTAPSSDLDVSDYVKVAVSASNEASVTVADNETLTAASVALYHGNATRAAKFVTALAGLTTESSTETEVAGAAETAKMSTDFDAYAGTDTVVAVQYSGEMISKYGSLDVAAVVEKVENGGDITATATAAVGTDVGMVQVNVADTYGGDTVYFVPIGDAAALAAVDVANYMTKTDGITQVVTDTAVTVDTEYLNGYALLLEYATNDLQAMKVVQLPNKLKANTALKITSVASNSVTKNNENAEATSFTATFGSGDTNITLGSATIVLTPTNTTGLGALTYTVGGSSEATVALGKQETYAVGTGAGDETDGNAGKYTINLTGLPTDGTATAIVATADVAEGYEALEENTSYTINISFTEGSALLTNVTVTSVGGGKASNAIAPNGHSTVEGSPSELESNVTLLDEFSNGNATVALALAESATAQYKVGDGSWNEVTGTSFTLTDVDSTPKTVNLMVTKAGLTTYYRFTVAISSGEEDAALTNVTASGVGAQGLNATAKNDPKDPMALTVELGATDPDPITAVNVALTTDTDAAVTSALIAATTGNNTLTNNSYGTDNTALSSAVNFSADGGKDLLIKVTPEGSSFPQYYRLSVTKTPSDSAEITSVAVTDKNAAVLNPITPATHSGDTWNYDVTVPVAEAATLNEATFVLSLANKNGKVTYNFGADASYASTAEIVPDENAITAKVTLTGDASTALWVKVTPEDGEAAAKVYKIAPQVTAAVATFGDVDTVKEYYIAKGANISGDMFQIPVTLASGYTFATSAVYTDFTVTGLPAGLAVSAVSFDNDRDVATLTITGAATGSETQTTLGLTIAAGAILNGETPTTAKTVAASGISAGVVSITGPTESTLTLTSGAKLPAATSLEFTLSGTPTLKDVADVKSLVTVDATSAGKGVAVGTAGVTASGAKITVTLDSTVAITGNADLTPSFTFAQGTNPKLIDASDGDLKYAVIGDLSASSNLTISFGNATTTAITLVKDQANEVTATVTLPANVKFADTATDLNLTLTGKATPSDIEASETPVNGLTAVANTTANSNVATVTISGTPTAEALASYTLVIPKEKVNSTTDITVSGDVTYATAALTQSIYASDGTTPVDGVLLAGTTDGTVKLTGTVSGLEFVTTPTASDFKVYSAADKTLFENNKVTVTGVEIGENGAFTLTVTVEDDAAVTGAKDVYIGVPHKAFTAYESTDNEMFVLASGKTLYIAKPAATATIQTDKVDVGTAISGTNKIEIALATAAPLKTSQELTENVSGMFTIATTPADSGLTITKVETDADNDLITITLGGTASTTANAYVVSSVTINADASALFAEGKVPEIGSEGIALTSISGDAKTLNVKAAEGATVALVGEDGTTAMNSYTIGATQQPTLKITGATGDNGELLAIDANKTKVNISYRLKSDDPNADWTPADEINVSAATTGGAITIANLFDTLKESGKKLAPGEYEIKVVSIKDDSEAKVDTGFTPATLDYTIVIGAASKFANVTDWSESDNELTAGKELQVQDAAGNNVAIPAGATITAEPTASFTITAMDGWSKGDGDEWTWTATADVSNGKVTLPAIKVRNKTATALNSTPGIKFTYKQGETTSEITFNTTVTTTSIPANDAAISTVTAGTGVTADGKTWDSTNETWVTNESKLSLAIVATGIEAGTYKVAVFSNADTVYDSATAEQKQKQWNAIEDTGKNADANKIVTGLTDATSVDNLYYVGTYDVEFAADAETPTNFNGTIADLTSTTAGAALANLATKAATNYTFSVAIEGVLAIGTTSAATTVTAGAPAKIAITTQPTAPTTATYPAALASDPAIKVTDAFGNGVANAKVDVTLLGTTTATTYEVKVNNGTQVTTTTGGVYTFTTNQAANALTVNYDGTTVVSDAQVKFTLVNPDSSADGAVTEVTSDAFALPVDSSIDYSGARVKLDETTVAAGTDVTFTIIGGATDTKGDLITFAGTEDAVVTINSQEVTGKLKTDANGTKITISGTTMGGNDTLNNAGNHTVTAVKIPGVTDSKVTLQGAMTLTVTANPNSDLSIVVSETQNKVYTSGDTVDNLSVALKDQYGNAVNDFTGGKIEAYVVTSADANGERSTAITLNDKRVFDETETDATPNANTYDFATAGLKVSNTTSSAATGYFAFKVTTPEGVEQTMTAVSHVFKVNASQVTATASGTLTDSEDGTVNVSEAKNGNSTITSGYSAQLYYDGTKIGNAAAITDGGATITVAAADLPNTLKALGYGEYPLTVKIYPDGNEDAAVDATSTATYTSAAATTVTLTATANPSSPAEDAAAATNTYTFELGLNTWRLATVPGEYTVSVAQVASDETWSVSGDPVTFNVAAGVTPEIPNMTVTVTNLSAIDVSGTKTIKFSFTNGNETVEATATVSLVARPETLGSTITAPESKSGVTVTSLVENDGDWAQTATVNGKIITVSKLIPRTYEGKVLGRTIADWGFSDTYENFVVLKVTAPVGAVAATYLPEEATSGGDWTLSAIKDEGDNTLENPYVFYHIVGLTEAQSADEAQSTIKFSWYSDANKTQLINSQEETYTIKIALAELTDIKVTSEADKVVTAPESVTDEMNAKVYEDASDVTVTLTANENSKINYVLANSKPADAAGYTETYSEPFVVDSTDFDKTLYVLVEHSTVKAATHAYELSFTTIEALSNTAPALTTAKLADHRTDGKIADDKLCTTGTYMLTAGDAGNKSQAYTLAAEDLIKHQNADGDVDYWVGVAFPTVDGATLKSVKYGEFTRNSEDNAEWMERGSIYFDAADWSKQSPPALELTYTNDENPEEAVTYTYPITFAVTKAKVATPVITATAGDNGEVTITCDTADAKIYYTTNGDVPTASSEQYDSTNKPAIDATKTIKAVAIWDGYAENSDVAEQEVTVTPKITVHTYMGDAAEKAGIQTDTTDGKLTVTSAKACMVLVADSVNGGYTEVGYKSNDEETHTYTFDVTGDVWVYLKGDVNLDGKVDFLHDAVSIANSTLTTGATSIENAIGAKLADVDGDKAVKFITDAVQVANSTLTTGATPLNWTQEAE